MARTNGPLLSLGASGSIAKTQVYSTWRGVPYVRRHVTPANPNTSGQQSTRNVFGYLNGLWKQYPSAAQAPWTLFASGQPLTNRNAFIGQNVKVLRPGTDLTGFIGSPGAKGGLAPASISVTPGTGQLTVAVTAPAIPTGWTIAKAVAIAIKDLDPHSSTDFTTVEGEDASSPYSIVLTGLATSLYLVSAWLQWTKPDGSTAYGVSVNGTGTPT